MTKRSNHPSPMMDLTPPRLELLYELHHPILPVPIDIASSSGERRLLLDIGGVSLSGPRVSGTHLPGASLLMTIHANGVARINGSFGIVTDDGHQLIGHITGRASLAPEYALALAAGEPLDPEAYYLRACIEHEAASDGPYDWLNRTLCVSKATRAVEGSHVGVWEIL